MFVERPELSSFNTAWSTKTTTQAVEELASYSLETKRIPDPYYFLLDQNGDLFSPSAQIKVKKIINTTAKVGVLEAEAFELISEWAREEESGAIAWLSPPETGIYPVSKVIISEIDRVNGAKGILNRAIVLDINGQECLDLGQRLSDYSTNRPFLKHLDQLRSTPMVLDTKNKPWIEIMQQVIPDQVLWNSVIRGDEMRAKQEALAEAERIFAKYKEPKGEYNYYGDNRDIQMDMQRMLGQNPGSCPIRFSSAKTALQVFSENSLTFSGTSSGVSSKDPDFCKVCPVCEAMINCVVKAGGSCPKCGAVKRCA